MNPGPNTFWPVFLRASILVFHQNLHVIAVLLCMQEDCARVLMFRGAEKEMKNSTGHSAYQVAITASYHNLADAIQKFNPEDVGE